MIVIKDAELSGQTDDAASATGGKFGLELIEQFVGRLTGLAGGRSFNFFVEHLASKLFIVQGACFIGVVQSKESVKVLKDE